MAARIPFVAPIPDNGVPDKNTCKCPYCGVVATLTVEAFTMEHIIYKCDNKNCQKSFYAKVKYTGATQSHGREPSIYHFDIIETYPKHVPEKHESIPANIWSDYLEACKAYDVEAFKSSVVMCRRTLQNVCLKRGASSKKDANGRYPTLRDQIKQAFPQKDYDLIQAFANNIKYFGDYGAHPQDDNIDDVTGESAIEILQFTYEILKIAYIVPWGLQQLTAKKSTKIKS